MSIVDRLNNAIKEKEENEQLVDRFLTSVLDLSKEIAIKGAKGEQLTKAESNFVNVSATLAVKAIIHGLGGEHHAD